MKRTLNIICGLTALILATVSCKKDDPQTITLDQVLVGEWHLVSAEAENQSIMTDIDVFLCIHADCSFELYQKSGTQTYRYDKYTGTCHTDGGILTGVYSNGKPWGGKYTYTVTAGNLQLKTTNNLEKQQYTSCQIPASVKDNANMINTKAVISAGTPIL